MQITGFAAQSCKKQGMHTCIKNAIHPLLVANDSTKGVKKQEYDSSLTESTGEISLAGLFLQWNL